MTEFHSVANCPALLVGKVDTAVAQTPASAACTDAVVSTYKSVYNKDCMEKLMFMSSSGSTPSFELICKSPCVGLMLLGFSKVKEVCPAPASSTTVDDDATFKLLCKKNEKNVYCGDALIAFAKSSMARRYGLSASSTKLDVANAVREEVIRLVAPQRLASLQASATTAPSSTPMPSGSATTNNTSICSSLKPILDIQAQTGCCMGEIMKMSMASLPADTVATYSSLLTSCGIKTTLCVADKATYGSVFVNLSFKITGTLDTAAKDKIKVGIANDLAAFWGIDPARITVTLVETKRLHALESTIKATAEVAGTAAGPTELSALESSLQTQGATAVPTIQTNAALASTGAGTVTVSSATATQLSPGATPPATAGAAALALPALAFLVAAVAALI